MSKTVRITLEMDSSFVRLLDANVQVSSSARAWLTNDNKLAHRLDVAGVLKVLVLAEARGGTESEIRKMIPREWRDHIRAVHELREATESNDD